MTALPNDSAISVGLVASDTPDVTSTQPSRARPAPSASSLDSLATSSVGLTKSDVSKATSTRPAISSFPSSTASTTLSAATSFLGLAESDSNIAYDHPSNLPSMISSKPSQAASSIIPTESNTLKVTSQPTESPLSSFAQYSKIPPAMISTRPTDSTTANVTVPHTALSTEEQAAQDEENEAAIQQAQNQIDIDSGDRMSISDAGYETDTLGSASTSLASSVRNYTFENGRRYHKFREGAYNFPNDDLEQDREDMKHAMVMNLCQQLHFAPIGPNPQNVLDMGTGTGIWAIEFGDRYQGANVLGVDLSPIQPTWVPPNVKFMVDDVESPWLKPSNYFDYVHARHTVMAIRDWPKLMGRALEHLKPGGWLELQEIHHFPQCHDGSMPPDHPIVKYWDYIDQGLNALGVNFSGTLLLANRMREAGFVNVTTRIFHVPIGLWPRNKVLKMVGLYWQTILIDGAQPIALGPMTRGLKWSKEEIEVWLVQVRKAYMDDSVHSHMPLHIICGQKPEEGVIYG